MNTPQADWTYQESTESDDPLAQDFAGNKKAIGGYPMMRYIVRDHPSGSGYQIVDTTTGLGVSGPSRLRVKDLWGNWTAVGMQCRAMNRADIIKGLRA